MYQKLINQKVINLNNEEGIVISIDDNYVEIQYKDEKKTYKCDIAFKRFLKFIDSSLNELIKNDICAKEEITKQKEQQLAGIEKFHKDRTKMVNKCYVELLQKVKYLKQLFGSDFVYPPLKEFEKKYKYFINKPQRPSLHTYDYWYDYY